MKKRDIKRDKTYLGYNVKNTDKACWATENLILKQNMESLTLPKSVKGRLFGFFNIQLFEKYQKFIKGALQRQKTTEKSLIVLKQAKDGGLFGLVRLCVT